MTVGDLKYLFETLYETRVRPEIDRLFAADRCCRPLFHILDGFPVRRFRSGLPLLFGRALAQDEEIFLPTAVASEASFAVALILDDIIDGDERRGLVDAAHVHWGLPLSLACAEFVQNELIAYLSRQFRRLGQPEHLRLQQVELFVHCNRQVAHSFCRDACHQNEPRPMNLSDLEVLYREKTMHGTYSLQSSASLIPATAHLAGDLAEFNKRLAIAGQIRNDLRHNFGDNRPEVCSDIKNTYCTMPLVLCGIDATDYFGNEHRSGEILPGKLLSLAIVEANRHIDEAKLLLPRFPVVLHDLLEAWANLHVINPRLIKEAWS
jgi:geranylgeranyl pyrophosphate synthase